MKLVWPNRVHVGGGARAVISAARMLCSFRVIRVFDVSQNDPVFGAEAP
jgi:hypothetical protein